MTGTKATTTKPATSATSAASASGTGPTGLPWTAADEVYSRVSFGDAVRAFQQALREGLDPATDFTRGILDLARGQLLLMPTESAQFVGVKVATVAPENPGRGLERIQGIYMLMDAVTLSPIALLDGVALTTLRTPALSAAAADYLAPENAEHLLVFGSGPQAWGHIEAMRSIRKLSLVTIVGRHEGRASALAEKIAATGLASRVGSAQDVHDAQIIACTTTARTPLFDGSLVADDSCTIAVGSHEIDAREIDSTLAGRAQIVVEDVTTALREAGDVIMPINEGAVDAGSLVPVLDIATGRVAVDRNRPRIFKSVGMSWQDLVIASAVYRAG